MAILSNGLSILEQIFLMDNTLSFSIWMSDIRNATPMEHSVCTISVSTVHMCEILEFNIIYIQICSNQGEGFPKSTAKKTSIQQI